MLKWVRLCAAFAILSAAAPAGAEPLLVTIDDLPLVSAQYFTHAEQQRQFRAILDALEKHGAVGLFFANGERIRPNHRPLLDELVRRGHIVGNHTYSHPSLNDVSVEEYVADIARGTDALRPWLAARHYFRYPFLETGRTRQERDAVVRALAEQGYRAVPVTIDSEDWDYNIEYTRAIKRGDPASAAKIASEYRARVLRNAAAGRADARRKLGRDISHVLLAHMSLLNADSLDELLGLLAGDGWSFALPEAALADPVYALEDEYFGPQGLTWLDRILR